LSASTTGTTFWYTVSFFSFQTEKMKNEKNIPWKNPAHCRLSTVFLLLMPGCEKNKKTKKNKKNSHKEKRFNLNPAQ
jgi:hypothetical protein